MLHHQMIRFAPHFFNSASCLKLNGYEAASDSVGTEAFAVFVRDILRAAIGVMDEATRRRPAQADGPFERAQGDFGIQRSQGVLISALLRVVPRRPVIVYRRPLKIPFC
jgi:hypothetical protein